MVLVKIEPNMAILFYDSRISAGNHCLCLPNNLIKLKRKLWCPMMLQIIKLHYPHFNLQAYDKPTLKCLWKCS